MRLLLFGATGRTGACALAAALAAGHEVSVFVRDPARLGATAAGLGVVRGDVLDAAAVLSAMPGHEAVLSTLGGGVQQGSALSTGTRNIVSAMEHSGVRRIVAIVGAGVLQGDEQRLRSELPDYPPRFAAISAEHRAAYDALRKSTLDWTLVCTPNLPEGLATGQFRVADSYLPEGGRSISTADTAAFLVAQLTRADFSRRRVGIAY